MSRWISFIFLLIKHGKWKKYLSEYDSNSSVSPIKKFILGIPYLGYFFYQVNFILFHSPKSRPRYLEHKKSEVIYYRIPKTGSTSIIHYFLSEYFNLSPENDYEIEMFAKELLSKDVVDPTKKIIAVVRNPILRFKSAYANIMMVDEKYIFKDYLFEILPRGLNVDQFAERLNKIPTRLIDDHFQSQSYLVSLAVKHAEIIKFEDGLAGFPISESHQKSKIPHLNPSNKEISLSVNTISILKELYKADFSNWYDD
ncbi:sulfotransferase family 2 domain-containing protein [Marinigracilibium pacificum]|uniref:Sulfotransferase family 2 domain-containing protein n=1 Tax=Marinigracilibium pacificum TaxID=2729599 RepID=A0A848IWZ6_9BACT|nr:sulfotransferase family 2 domain-containing protein [Marinigracilibium pacificum]NMM49053.1 sulfotransferase family 2 domain-containing protein [Marinigracilibium pacificum]